jgi:hypothetical protein
MFDAQITVALFAAFLLGIVAGSGIGIIVGGWLRLNRHNFPGFTMKVMSTV